MDAFDASVEQRDHLEYGGRPVIAGAALDGVIERGDNAPLTRAT